MTRSQEIFDAAVSYATKHPGHAGAFNVDLARDMIWMAQCSFTDRSEALKMLTQRVARGTT